MRYQHIPVMGKMKKKTVTSYAKGMQRMATHTLLVGM